MPILLPSDRLRRLPPYLFAELERRVSQLRAQGKDIIDLSIGDPDLPPPRRFLDSLAAHLSDEGIHRYPTSRGTEELRGAVSRWYRRRHGVQLDPMEVCLGVGSKELIAHLPLAVTNPGDVVLLPEPGYPPYRSGAIFALCEPYVLPLKQERGFLPDLDAIPPDVARRARILYVNYPNNPTGAVATRAFYDRCVAFAKANDLLVVSDAAYGEIYFDEQNPPVSFLESAGAKEVGVEVHSATKTFGMAGWRVAWMVGNGDVVERIRGFKANCDSGQFAGFQKVVAEALDDSDADRRALRQMYRRRCDVLVSGLRKLGWEVSAPQATFFVWFPVPGARPSMEFIQELLERTGVLVTPGSGFGPHGEGFVRVALTVPEARMQEAVDRIAGAYGR